MKTYLWSGGIDSTYMIEQALQRGEWVHILTADVYFSEGMRRREANARSILLPKFSNQHLIYKTELSTVLLVSGEFINFVSAYAHLIISHPIIHTGVLGTLADDLPIYEKSIAAQKFVSAFNKVLELPLIEKNKIDILKECPSWILENAVFCRSENDEPTGCGKCKVCLHYIKSVTEAGYKLDDFSLKIRTL